MLPSKRVRKTPTQFEIVYIKKNKQDNNSHQTPKIKHCDYEIMPAPVKYDDAGDILLLCGSIPLILKNNNFFTDFSLLNDFHLFGDVRVTTHHSGQKLLSITTVRRKEARFARWKVAMKKIVKASDPKMRRWGRAIRDFSMTYGSAIDKYVNQQMQLRLEDEKQFAMENNDTRGEEIWIQQPFIQLESCFKGHDNLLTGIIVSETLLEVLGHTIDSFVSIVLREGLPEVLQLLSPTNSSSIQAIMEDYTMAAFSDHLTPQFDSTLLMRSGHVRNAKVETHFSMHNRGDGRYGSKTTFVFKEYEQPYLPVKIEAWEPNISQEFLANMIAKEEENRSFLLNYYEYLVAPYSVIPNIDVTEKVEDDSKLEEI